MGTGIVEHQSCQCPAPVWGTTKGSLAGRVATCRAPGGLARRGDLATASARPVCTGSGRAVCLLLEHNEGVSARRRCRVSEGARSATHGVLRLGGAIGDEALPRHGRTRSCASDGVTMRYVPAGATEMRQSRKGSVSRQSLDTRANVRAAPIAEHAGASTPGKEIGSSLRMNAGQGGVRPPHSTTALRAVRYAGRRAAYVRSARWSMSESAAAGTLRAVGRLRA